MEIARRERSMMPASSSSLRSVLAAVALSALAACGGDSVTGPALPPGADPDVRRATSRFAVTLLAAAMGAEGSALLDNFLPCVRRGVLAYHNTDDGREVAFHGCDLGDGVVVDGTGEIRWAGFGLAPSRGEFFCGFDTPPECITEFIWEGRLVATVDGRVSVTLDDLHVRDLVLASGGGRFPEAGLFDQELGFVSMNVERGPETFAIADTGLPGSIFDGSGVIASPLPNPSGSVSALTDADVRRLVLHPGILFLAFLANEATQSSRGDHTHTSPCSTADVAYDANQLPTIALRMTDCETLGLSLSGDFAVRLESITGAATVMSLTGEMTVRGGVPEIEIRRLDLTIGSGGAADRARFVGSIDGPSDARTFDFTVTVDD